MNPIKCSLTFRNASGSDSVLSPSSTAIANRRTRASQSSSISRSDRNVLVALRTYVSIMKKPVISCVTDKSEAIGRGLGKMRSDCACQKGSDI
jgi:hypothetical protein